MDAGLRLCERYPIQMVFEANNVWDRFATLGLLRWEQPNAVHLKPNTGTDIITLELETPANTNIRHMHAARKGRMVRPKNR